jgi:hypothetical protein
MKHVLTFLGLMPLLMFGQVSPAVSSWLQNNTITGTYYVQGNSTAISNSVLVNCQTVSYGANNVFVEATGIPSYPTGPFLDGNPSQATDQSRIFRIPLNPIMESGTPSNTTGGNIGIFINGVGLFDYRDGVGWNSTTNTLCGGPGNAACPGNMSDWNRDAIPAERDGFDCAKGHPAMGNYHHHQNPSAFDLDLDVISTVCNLYDADGLYVIDSNQHAPLIGFAYDGFPIYGAYGFANTDGTGGVKRMLSGYHLRNISQRTQHANGTIVGIGPAVDNTYFLGYFREDYEFIDSTSQGFYLDEHNGRFCVTPEYPNGIYAYFCTVDEKWNSVYPYAVGPTFYGEVTGGNATNIPTGLTVYTGNVSLVETELPNLEVFPNPSTDLLTIQVKGLTVKTLHLELRDASGRIVAQKQINAGQTVGYFDTETYYNGTYLLLINDGQNTTRHKIVIQH